MALSAVVHAQVEFLHTLALLDEPRPANGAAPAHEVPELRAARGLFRWEARRLPWPVMHRCRFCVRCACAALQQNMAGEVAQHRMAKCARQRSGVATYRGTAHVNMYGDYLLSEEVEKRLPAGFGSVVMVICSHHRRYHADRNLFGHICKLSGLGVTLYPIPYPTLTSNPSRTT